MSTFHERKAERTKKFLTQINGFPMVTCVCCNGSGRYDVSGSPDCGACDGKGKVRSKYSKDDPRFTEYG